ncbi:phosphoribosylamine--glycine ligase [Bartonella sp. DGB1]|uniref:phosphoribosylamine--glycine ligase n=1 Tax=Bartonella sp. DGB1 TaxID=3239807 RepID=UPI003523FEFE
MNILLIGSGGREHALAWKISQSPLVKNFYALPGSLGISHLAQIIQASITDIEFICEFAKNNQIDLVVIGPEQPLIDGLSDALTNNNILTFAPSQAAAILEGSKGFTRDLCYKYNIPSAKYARFSSIEKAKEYLSQQTMPIVIKQDGLAAGKGVVVTNCRIEAQQTIEKFLSNTENPNIVIEECLIGEEVSFFCICDGEKAIAFGNAQDHKRLFNNDQGPNTGGMGAYSPAPIFTDELQQEVLEKIINPTLLAMKENNMPFKGILYAGLMLTKQGAKLIEYNVRLGDPECQILMRRLKDDIIPWLKAAAEGKLPDNKQPNWSAEFATCIVMAAEGYPEAPVKGDVITGIEEAEKIENIKLFYAGVSKDENQNYITAGGRVLNITSVGKDLKQALDTAYYAVDKISFNNAQWRTDIGQKGLAFYKTTKA